MAFPDDLDPNDPQELDTLKLAFAVWISNLIVEADGFLDLEEIRVLTGAFPNDLLMAHGLTDARTEFTEAYHAARRRALRVLPEHLTPDEKLELVTVFHSLCLASQGLQQAELLVLREAAEAIGINVRQLSRHLRSLKT